MDTDAEGTFSPSGGEGRDEGVRPPVHGCMPMDTDKPDSFYCKRAQGTQRRDASLTRLVRPCDQFAVAMGEN
jgi:hypothetical protein